MRRIWIGVLVLACGCYSEHEYLLSSSTLAAVQRRARPTALVRAQRKSDGRAVHLRLETQDLRARPEPDGRWSVRSRAMSGMTVAGTILISCGMLLGGAGVGVKARSGESSMLGDPLIVFGVVPTVLGILFVALGPSARPAEVEVLDDGAHSDDELK